MVGRGVTICRFRYSCSRNMNWALDRRGEGGSLCLLLPHSESEVPTVCIGLGKRSRGEKGSLLQPPKNQRLVLGVLRRDKGRKQGEQQCQQDRQRLWASRRPFSGSLAPADHPFPKPPHPSGESSWSGHPSSPSGSPLCHPRQGQRNEAGLGTPRSGFQS